MDTKWKWFWNVIKFIKCIFAPEYSIYVLWSKEVGNPKGWIQNYMIYKNNKKFLTLFVQHTQPDDGNSYQNVGGIIACGVNKYKKGK